MGGTILRCFQGPGKRREEFCPKELAAHGETESKRQIHEKAHPSQDSKEREREIPFNWEGIRKSFLKEVGKRGSGGGVGHDQCPPHKRARTRLCHHTPRGT